MRSKNKVIVHIDRNMPLIYGECVTCNHGKHSLILIDYVPHIKPGESIVYLKCMVCATIHQTKVKAVSREG